MTYLALGDSVAFGETNYTKNPSNGDRGYVSLYADYLATRDGGVRPNVVNLAIEGETTTSFSTGAGRVPLLPDLSDAKLAALNTNYATNPFTTQLAQMQAAIASQAAAGNTIKNVSVSLGSDDLFAMALKPTFPTLSAAQQQLALGATLATVQSNLNALLTQIHTLLPAANVLVMGTYNPFPAVPSSPFAALAGPAIAGLNQVLQGVAAAQGARYVDTASVFAGNESAYTYITSLAPGSTNVYNVHPNSLGYAAIEGQMQAVPEPSTVVLFGAFGFGLYVTRRRRGRIASNP
jgi:lysophospholipase L1-like esterase